MKNSDQINQILEEISDWKKEKVNHYREIILSVDSEINEVVKWNSPVFVKKKNICSIGIFKDHIKLNFFEGATLNDPSNLFNTGFDAKKSRGIDIYEKILLNEDALRKLIREAIEE